ncbi:unnamed protein product [Clavelina lepadiformis]|uniref:Uncharacterized protein n=1 Tax=Clavelina lepadiformis TaxID=159417 RepID=A0ABP0H444_CLALP
MRPAIRSILCSSILNKVLRDFCFSSLGRLLPHITLVLQPTVQIGGRPLVLTAVTDTPNCSISELLQLLDSTL